MYNKNFFFCCCQELAEHGCIEKLATVLLDIETRILVLTEVTAALAVMADDGESKFVKKLHFMYVS
jgi:hypothetical protein